MQDFQPFGSISAAAVWGNISGTLTRSWTILNGTNKVTIQLNANTSLTPTIFQLSYFYHSGTGQAAIAMGGDA